MTVWLITPPHPDPRKRRVLTRRVAGRLLRFSRVRVHRARLVPVALLETLRLARIATPLGEAWVPFDRLASDRSRFLSRWIDLTGAIDLESTGSGDDRLPVTTGPTDRSTTDRPIRREPIDRRSINRPGNGDRSMKDRPDRSIGNRPDRSPDRLPVRGQFPVIRSARANPSTLHTA